MERVGANSYLTFGGTIAASVTNAATISGSFLGEADYCEQTTADNASRSCEAIAHAHCSSQTHQLTLTRRRTRKRTKLQPEDVWINC